MEVDRFHPSDDTRRHVKSRDAERPERDRATGFSSMTFMPHILSRVPKVDDQASKPPQPRLHSLAHHNTLTAMRVALTYCY